jgi:hypothetical protein
MGYIGKVSIFGLPTRALSSSLAAKQSITHPDVVDNRIDRSLYQLGAVEVDGDVALPMIKDDSSATFLNTMWGFATQRDAGTGELSNANQEVVLEYSFQTARTFKGCRINTFEFRATAGDRMEATVGFMGTIAVDGGSVGDPYSTSPVRVLTWDDINIDGDGNVIFPSCLVKEFTATINNNCSRNYTFCDATVAGGGASHNLFASNISTGKRFVNGSIGFQGFSPTDATGAYQNPVNTTSTDTITFTLRTGGFTKTFNNVIYEYQDISINVGLITSTVNWYAHGGAGGTPAFT